MLTCTILHNMIMENECDYDGNFDKDEPDPNRSQRTRVKIYDDLNLPHDPRIGQIITRIHASL